MSVVYCEEKIQCFSVGSALGEQQEGGIHTGITQGKGIAIDAPEQFVQSHHRLSVGNNWNSGCNGPYHAIILRYSHQISVKLPRTGIQYQLKPTPLGWKSID